MVEEAWSRVVRVLQAMVSSLEVFSAVAFLTLEKQHGPLTWTHQAPLNPDFFSDPPSGVLCPNLWVMMM